ncbi:unnamed protein product, partial [Rotaria sp. Silwood1]
ISRAQPEHTGRYRCVVADSLETSCHITVREPDYRFIQSLPSNIQFSPETDRSLTLDGTLNRKPTQIQWFKNSIEIFPSQKYELVNEHHVIALIIHDLSSDDQGLYRCVVANGQATSECQVSMNLMTENDRRIIKPLQDQNIYVHDTCTLNVKFQGDAPDVKWYKNGQEIYPNNKYRFVQHGNEQTLIIDDCQLVHDQAYYSLRLPSNPKLDLTSCYVQVKDKHVNITKPLEPQRCILGQEQQVQFDCETTPTDKKPVWFFNNRQIDNTSKYELVSTDNTHHLLFIHQPELSDQGQYTISFPESDQSSTANLQVLQTPSTLEFIQPLDEVFLCEEGDNFVLVTRTNKPTHVSWMKNGYKLSIKSKLDSLPTNEHRLTVDKAQKLDHEGIYTCIIDANNVATQCHVKIIERELQLIQPLPKQIRLNEHDTLTLICETNRKPKKVQWFKDQSNIPLETNNSLMIINADETCTLIINNANKFDSGIYTCRLEDRLITVSDVKIHESAAQFVDGPQSYLVWRRREDGPVVNISCTLNKPNVPVKWFRENQEIRPELNNKYEIISEGTIQCLLIHDAQKEDSNKYVISLGSTYRACHLDVIDDTGISTDEEGFDRVVQPLTTLQRQEVMEGDSLTIEVSPDSDLQPLSPNQFRFLKNNRPIVGDSHIQLERDTSSIDSNRWLIRLVDVDLNDSGVYSIEINNQIRQDLLDLHVKKRPMQRQFITLPKDEFYLHETITLECKFERPIKTKNLQPTWFKNGRPIQPSNHYIVSVESPIKDGPTKYSITIKDVDFTDEGVYELRSDYLIVETPFIRIVERPIQPAPLRTVTEGDSLQIDVNIDQNEYQQISPDDLLNQITILKDNRAIINKPEINKWFDGQQFKVELKNLSLNDRGLYEIDIQGQRTPICLLDVKERQPDVFLLELDRNTFEEGETIRLACTFPQRPGPIANWFKDGQLIHPHDNIQLTDENNTLTIIIRNAKRTDSGVYEVRIGSVIARAPMIHVIPKQQLQQQQQQPDIPVQNVREGDTVTLSVEGLQTNVRPQDIQLLKNGKPIMLSQKPKTSMKREDDKLRIILQTLALDDSALYSVQIQNDIHPLAKIVVEPRQPEIQEMQLEQDTFYVGDTVTLDLEFTNEPTEQPRWAKDNVPLRNNDRVSIDNIGNRVTLIVRDLRLDDAGIYEVQSGPLIVRTPHINVIERSHDITEIVDETITYTITPNRPLPPVEAKVCTIKEGDDVTLKISSPTPITINDVQLYKNGQPIPTDNETRKHLRLEQFGNKDVRLTIKDARLIDTGEYSALINDNIQPIIKLDVQPRDMQIQMINLPQDTFNEGETLKIDCRFPHSNINTDYQWYKDNQPLIPNDRIVMRKDAFNDSLVIVNLQPTDAGVYELRSRNNILRTPLIKVIPSDKKINIEELRPQVSSKLVHEGDTVTFELTPNFDVPLNKIELFHEENPITHEPYVHMKKDYKTNSITVQIEDIKIPDHGLYTAIVQGQSVPLAELIVEQRPTIIQNMDLPKDVFYTDERLELECEFPQVPKGDQPKWFKNNQPLQSTLNVHLVTENQGRKHSLIIDHLKPEDTGQYELRVKGLIVRTPLIRVIQREQPQTEEQPSPYIVTEVEDSQDKFKLKPEPPQRRISNVVIEDITNQPSAPSEPTSRENTQRVQEGDSIKLKVVSTFDVKPNQFRLIHDGAPVDLKKRSSIIIERVSAGTYAVSLLNLRVSDSGLYEYQIEGAPTPKHLVKLYVEPRPIKEKTLHVPQTTFNVGESILFKIDFDEKDQITEIPKWYKNEMIIPIDTSSRHKQTIDRINRTHTFEIYNLQLEDSGVYEMRTPNLTVKTPEIKIIPQPVQKPVEEEIRPTQQTVRQSSLTIDMKKPKEQLVESRPVEEFQLIDENIPIHEVTEGDMMHLTVEKPSTVHLSDIKLFKNNQPLVSSKNIHVESTSPTTIDIKFSPVELIDTGFYSIKIRDQIQPIMQLNVREKPIQRQIMNLPQDTFIENETLTIECKFDSKPDAKFVWTKDGSILYNDSRIIIKQKNETFTLIIKDLKLSDQGVYSLESKYLILDTPFIHILPKQQQPTVQIQHDETAVTMQPSVTVADKEDKIEEIKIKEQPLEQTPAPTAFIESAKKKPDETITTTTTVEQQQEPSVQVSSSAVKPKQPTEDISVQTQQSVPVEQVVEVKTTTVEETQPQPTVTVTEQQEQIIEQPIVTPVEQPKPSVETQQEKEQEQAVKTTTQVEEQPVPQVTTDALSAQPKTEEQTILTTDMTTTQEQISPAVTTEQEVIQTEKPQSIVTTEKQIETVEKRPEVEKPIVEQTITKAEETTITRDITPLIEDITKERRPIAEQPTVSEQAVTVTEEIQQKEKAPAEEQPKEETSKPSQTVVEETTTIVQHDTIVEEDKPAKIESTTEVTKVEETLPEVSITTVQKQMKRVEEQQLTSIEKPTFEQTITTETISTDKELPTTSPVIEETQRPTEKLSTTEETIQETKVPIEEQPKYTIETTFTEEEVIEETPKVPTDIVEEKSETKPTEQITTVVEEETTIEKEKPLTDQLAEEKPKVEETVSDMPTTTIKEEIKPGEETITTEEITTIEAIPTVQETITTTEEIIRQDVSSTVEEAQKPTEERPIVEKITTTEEIVQETKVPIEEQPKHAIQTTSTTEEVIEEAPKVPTEIVEEKPETKSIGPIITTFQEETPVEEEKPTQTQPIEELTKTEKIIRETPTTIEEELKTEEEQPLSIEKTTVEKRVTKEEEVALIETTPTVTETLITKETVPDQEQPNLTTEVIEEYKPQIPEQPTTTAITEETTTITEQVVSKDTVPSVEEYIITTEEKPQEQISVGEEDKPVVETVSTVEDITTTEKIGEQSVPTEESSKAPTTVIEELVEKETEIKPAEEITTVTEETLTTEQEKPIRTQQVEKMTKDEAPTTILSEQITATQEELPSLGKPAVEQITQEKPITSIEEPFTTAEGAVQKDSVPSAEETVKIAEITPLAEEVASVERVEDQSIPTDVTSKAEAQVVEDIVTEKLETKSTEQMTTMIQEDVTIEEMKPDMIQTVEEAKTEETLPETTIKPSEVRQNTEEITTSTEEVPVENIVPTQEQPKETVEVIQDKTTTTTETATIEEVTTTKETTEEPKVLVEQQLEHTIETTFTEEEAIEETPKVLTDIVKEKFETKPTEHISTVVEEERTTEKEKPLTDQLTEEKPKVESIISDVPTTTVEEEIITVEEQLTSTEKPTVEPTIIAEEITTTETVPKVKKTITTTEEIIQQDVSPVVDETQKPTEKKLIVEKVTSTEEVIEEKPKIPTTTTEEMTITEEVTQEKKAPTEEQPKHLTEPTVLVEESIAKKPEPQPLEEVTTLVQDEIIIEEHKPTIAKPTEETFVTEEIVPEVLTKMPEEDRKSVAVQLGSIEKSTLEQTITKDEEITTETTPTVKGTSPSTTEEINQQDIMPMIQETQKSTEKIPSVTELPTIQETIKEQPPETKAVATVIERKPDLRPSEEVTTTLQEEIIMEEEKPTTYQTTETITTDTPTVTTEEKTITVAEKLISDENRNLEQTITAEEQAIVTTETTILEQEKPSKPAEVPVQTVEETTNLAITLQTPIHTKLVILKDGLPLPVTEHLQITPISLTTTKIEIIKAKPEDEGEYTMVVDGKEQPLMKLQVTPKPVVRQEIQIPKVKFNEKETLTIVCQFDATPEEPFSFLHNEQPIVPDSRVTTTVEDNKYTIVVKDLRPEEDEGVYTLK